MTTWPWAWLKRKSINWALRATVKPLWRRQNLSAEELQRLLAQAESWLPVPGGAPGLRKRIDHHFEAEWFEPKTPTTRVLLYLHGGAWIIHVPRLYRNASRRLARLLQARVLLPDYRLAPEHRFPAASDDALASYEHLLSMGVRPQDIVIGGDSAGGNLALVTLLRARDRGLPMPACAFVFSPVTDLTLSGPSVLRNGGTDVMFSAAAAPLLSHAYLGESGQADHPWVSPLKGELHGLPPILLQASDSEMLTDDSLRFAQHVRAAGGKAEASLWPDLPHVFQLIGALSESHLALQEVADFVRRSTTPGATAPTHDDIRNHNRETHHEEAHSTH
ncbi:alpha/beta hydrolase [Variovorax dokdonensis]|uniref:Alpha/beta hydrolase n=1 Tax=Variovorax dokdonensis TaxID=344883 RepID=A0ABT7N7J5_9BURK|nr:alpha/beta hydrolase [Variovorax dokdonensis]MDM0043896.1 alpha/beta hydrolase [Variovorax dokdonensis]